MPGFNLKTVSGLLVFMAVSFGSGCAVNQSNQQSMIPQVYKSQVFNSHERTGAGSESQYDQSGLASIIRVHKSQGNAQMSVMQGRGQHHVLSSLQQQYSKWAGTPYRLGGNTDRGIDCSAFMMKIFDDGFNRKLPRTTAQQVQAGNYVNKGELQVGDLVFFKTGRSMRHVGVFMGGSNFLHASSSEGVTLSRLDDPYWSKRYWQSRRVL